jgi:hypothetical protein
MEYDNLLSSVTGMVIPKQNRLVPVQLMSRDLPAVAPAVAPNTIP